MRAERTAPSSTAKNIPGLPLYQKKSLTLCHCFIFVINALVKTEIISIIIADIMLEGAEKSISKYGYVKL